MKGSEEVQPVYKPGILGLGSSASETPIGERLSQPP